MNFNWVQQANVLSFQSESSHLSAPRIIHASVNQQEGFSFKIQELLSS